MHDVQKYNSYFLFFLIKKLKYCGNKLFYFSLCTLPWPTTHFHTSDVPYVKQAGIMSLQLDKIIQAMQKEPHTVLTDDDTGIVSQNKNAAILF